MYKSQSIQSAQILERSTIAKKKWYNHRVDFSWTDTGFPRVRTFPSFLPGVRVPPQETHNSLEKEEKKLQNICWNIEFFPQTFVFHIDNIRRIKQKQKIHRRAKSEHRNIPANFVINYDACAHPGNQYCEDEKHFTFLKRLRLSF